MVLHPLAVLDLFPLDHLHRLVLGLMLPLSSGSVDDSAASGPTGSDDSAGVASAEE